MRKDALLGKIRCNFSMSQMLNKVKIIEASCFVLIIFCVKISGEVVPKNAFTDSLLVTDCYFVGYW